MFGRKSKIKKAVARALARVEAESDLADYSSIEALATDLQAESFARTALALFDDERYAAAAHSLDRAIALAPDEVDLHELAAQIAIELDDLDRAITARQQVVARRPRDTKAVRDLAELLIGSDRIDEAIALLRSVRDLEDPEVEAKLAEALYAAGHDADALAILDPVCAYYDAQLKQLSAGDWQALKARADDSSRLRDQVYAALHGREATIELHAAAGKLDARAGINYKLLGAQLATKSARVAEVLELQDTETTERRGRALLARDAKSAPGLVLVGIARLRLGDVATARKTFERACEADGGYFPAFMGLGAAIDHEHHQFHRRAMTFAMPATLPAALAEVVPDFAVLTDAERRVVWASIAPLAELLPTLAERDVRMHILPIEARATDVDLFEDAAGERHGDHRSYDAITGVATHGGAIAKIEELLDVGEEGWTFAHELAHLAFFHLDDERAEPLHVLYERAVDVGYANIEYALENADELFAVSYVDYLRVRHDMPGAPLRDDAGIQDELMRFFDQL